MAGGEEWLILDIFRNVRGPYTRDEVLRRAKREPNFFVYVADEGSWVAVDSVPELASGAAPADAGGNVGDVAARYKAKELERAVDELLGVCKGIIADGRVDTNEVVFLKSWLEQNRELATIWPANVLSERIGKIFEDGIVDQTEREELAELLYRITGEKPGIEEAMKLAASLAIDFPEPRLEFEGKTYCLSGRFAYGPRAKCEAAVRQRGGVCHEHPNPETDFLVIGALADSQADLEHGRNIEFVVTNAPARSRTAIVSEENWSYHL